MRPELYGFGMLISHSFTLLEPMDPHVWATVIDETKKYISFRIHMYINQTYTVVIFFIFFC